MIHFAAHIYYNISKVIAVLGIWKIRIWNKFCRKSRTYHYNEEGFIWDNLTIPSTLNVSIVSRRQLLYARRRGPTGLGINVVWTRERVDKDKAKDDGSAGRGAGQEATSGYTEASAEAWDTDTRGDLDENCA